MRSRSSPEIEAPGVNAREIADWLTPISLARSLAVIDFPFSCGIKIVSPAPSRPD